MPAHHKYKIELTDEEEYSILSQIQDVLSTAAETKKAYALNQRQGVFLLPNNITTVNFGLIKFGDRIEAVVVWENNFSELFIPANSSNYSIALTIVSQLIELWKSKTATAKDSLF